MLGSARYKRWRLTAKWSFWTPNHCCWPTVARRAAVHLTSYTCVSQSEVLNFEVTSWHFLHVCVILSVEIQSHMNELHLVWFSLCHFTQIYHHIHFNIISFKFKYIRILPLSFDGWESSLVSHHEMFVVWHVGNDALFFRLALNGRILTAGGFYEHVSIQVLQ